MPATISAPSAPGEYAAPYAGYVAAVGDADVLHLLERQLDTVPRLLGGVSDSRAGYRYAPGKWSVKEVVGHLGDTERIMAYRALRIARGDATPLPGFDENAFVRGADFDRRTLGSLVDEWVAVRQTTLALLRPLDAEALQRIGSASGHPVSVRALAYIMAGHVTHHLGVLQTRYLAEGEWTG
jgi:hypothetical protein